MSRVLKAIFAVTILGLLVIGYFLYVTKNGDAPQNPRNDVEGVALESYSNPTYGISFTYPGTYELVEREVGDAHRGHYVIMLTRKSDMPLPQNGEGPPTISIDVYQNDIDAMTLMEWLHGTNAGNFKLSDGTYASTTVSGIEAVQYHWSGLYEADALAFLHDDWFVTVTGMYLDPNDEIRSDFQKVVSSFNLTNTR